VDNAHRRLLHRHVKTNEIRHLTAPSSMLKIRLTSNHSSYLKGMRAHHSIPSRSRRDTPSSENLKLVLERRRWVESGSSDARLKMPKKATIHFQVRLADLTKRGDRKHQ